MCVCGCAWVVCLTGLCFVCDLLSDVVWFDVCFVSCMWFVCVVLCACVFLFAIYCVMAYGLFLIVYGVCWCACLFFLVHVFVFCVSCIQ